ncbi:hypothetical protein IV102_00295 [bacterium]|nr:hypothetical protein [bacterium]
MKIHLRYNGKSTTIEGPNGTDQEVIRHLEQRGYLPPRTSLIRDASPLMIDRHPDGMVVRPPAVFG